MLFKMFKDITYDNLLMFYTVSVPAQSILDLDSIEEVNAQLRTLSLPASADFANYPAENVTVADQKGSELASTLLPPSARSKLTSRMIDDLPPISFKRPIVFWCCRFSSRLANGDSAWYGVRMGLERLNENMVCFPVISVFPFFLMSSSFVVTTSYTCLVGPNLNLVYGCLGR